MRFIIIGTILISGIVLWVVLTIPHQHNEDCQWIAPLKTNYVMCYDGKVREK